MGRNSRFLSYVTQWREENEGSDQRCENKRSRSPRASKQAILGCDLIDEVLELDCKPVFYVVVAVVDLTDCLR